MHHELIKFLKVAELSSFTAAAKTLHVSQPALSTAIKNLEKDLGIELIARAPGEFNLTEAGKLVYESAQRVQLTLENLNRRLDDLKHGRTSPTRVGLIDSLAQELFGSETFDPDLLEVIVDNSSRLIGKLETGQLDILFITKQENLGEPFSAEVIGQEKFALVSSANSKSVSKQLKQKQLKDFLAYNHESTTFALIDEALREQGFGVEYSLFSTHPELMKTFAMQGKGVAMLPIAMVKDDIKQGTLKKYQFPKFTRDIQCVWRRGTYVNEPLSQVIKEIRGLL